MDATTAFDPFDDAAGEAWRAWEEPMVAHVACSAPVRAVRVVVRTRQVLVTGLHDFVPDVPAPRWFVPPRAAPPVRLMA